MAHAILSPSSADRWLHCTPSARENAKVADTTSVYAEEGTLAHAIGELGLLKFTKAITPQKYGAEMKKLRGHELYYKGMEGEVDEYVNFCIDEYNTLDSAIMQVEERLDLTNWAPDAFGTGDCVIVSPNTIHIIDLKFGRGQYVEVFENPQLKLYALGALDDWSFIFPDIEEVKITIAQVRLGESNTYRMTKEDLIKWGEEVVRPKADLAYKGQGERAPGSWCKWCKVRQRCKVRAKALLDDTGPGPEELTNDEIAKLLHSADDVMDWAKELKEYALDRALAGTAFKGWKVVEGRSNRKITDEEGLASALIEEGFSEEEIYKPKSLEGITKLTKLVGKSEFDDLSAGYIEKPKGRPTLVVESDKRPEYSTVADEFEFEN